MISIVITTQNRKSMLYQLVTSLYKFPPKNPYEIIVVDDCSETDYSTELLTKFPKVNFLRHQKRLGLIKARNKGWQHSKGEIILFIDDDNEIKDLDFFDTAIKTFKQNPNIGIIGCRTYYFNEPTIIQFGPNKFNKLTGKNTFLWANKKDCKQNKGLLVTNDVPNAFFTTKKLLNKTQGFSEEIIQTFSEADYAEKVRQQGYLVYHYSELKVFHKSPKMDQSKLTVRHMGGSPWRFYYLMRNRFVYIKKWGSFSDKIFFTILFSHIYTFYYILNLIKLGELEMIKSGLRGIKDGYIYMLTGRLNNFYNNK